MFPNVLRAYYNDRNDCARIEVKHTVQPLVKTHNLQYTYADDTQVDLAGCDLAIWPGDRVAVVGRERRG